ncbi:hypothetical protein M0805_009313 [Coniferiporia weirii]|nr:hypothetical protein M0805_009313 [Coniferiporia weirii]
MSSRDLTARWLAQVAAPYPDPGRVCADVLAALDRCPSLRPKTDVYTYDDGRTQLLLCLHGLLPISFRAASYNIPVAVWITLPYPAEPPLVYVIPTSDMLVRPSPAVDLSGRCSLEYATIWSRKPDTCSLSALLEAMQAHFSREPPLYSKPPPKPSAPISPATTNPPASATSPSSGVNRDHVLRLGQVQAQAQVSHPPRLPPKPGVVSPPSSAPLSSPSLPAPSASQAHLELHASTPGPPPSRPQTHAIYAPAYVSHAAYASAADARANQHSPPPVPPHPTGHGPTSVTNTPQASTFQPNSVQAQSRQGPPPYVNTHPPVPTRPPVPPSPLAQNGPQRSVSLPQTLHAQSAPVAGSPPPPIPPSVHAQPPPGPLATPALSAIAAPGYPHPLQYQHLPATALGPAVYSPAPGAPTRPPPSLPPPDLLDHDDTAGLPFPGTNSGSSAPPPPRPPNPQTLALHNALLVSLHDALARLSASHADAVARQRAQQAELLAGPVAIRDESARLTAVRDVCRAVGARWSAVVREGEGVLTEVRRRGEVAIDEMVCASSIVGNQLINLVAEDNAIEDTMYHLHRALNSGRIDLERFLRTTRVLAEEQFMKRALVEKIVRGLPMGMSLS